MPECTSRFQLSQKAEENCQNIIEMIINNYQPQQIYSEYHRD
ncbi:hypothetical protein VB711_22970 [Cronbergia sp. UHCC 0137]|nr:hypothetical protein [Cronbergia sp. UHCC 0137]MEA5620680.1 hypothetical protein [Cronbergia sp. UHCC 0137]